MLKKHTISIKNALSGVIVAIKTQPNFKIHLTLSTVALLGSWFFKITSSEFLIIVILIAMGIVIEMINTAIEEATDAIDTTWRADIKMAKDVAAGAMLVFACGALTIASIIFVPRILVLFKAL